MIIYFKRQTTYASEVCDDSSSTHKNDAKQADILKTNNLIKQMQYLENQLNGFIDKFDLTQPFEQFTKQVNPIR